jgi:hypothetical protein
MKRENQKQVNRRQRSEPRCIGFELGHIEKTLKMSPKKEF